MVKTLNQLMLSRGVGVFYVDIARKLLQSNSAARDILSINDGVQQVGKKIVFSNKEANTRLNMMCKDIEGQEKEAVIYVSRDSGQPPYKVTITKVFDDVMLEGTKQLAVIILISEPRINVSFPQGIFKDYYKLTQTELCLAKALFEEQSLAEYAENRGIKVTTARWTLDNIFDKTFTHSQGELKSLAFRYSI